MKEVILFASYPNKENPEWGIFNKRATETLKKKVNVTVISVRTWRHGRSFVSRVNDRDVTVITCHVPHYPGSQAIWFALSKWTILLFLSILLRSTLSKAEIFHSVGGSPRGIYVSYLARWFKKKHVVQLTGGDVNTEFPQLIKKKLLGSFPKSGCHMLVGNSKRLVKDFNSLFSSSYPIRCVYRGVDPERFAFQKINAPSHISFLYLGGFYDYPESRFGSNTKGGIDLLKSWLQVEHELAKQNATLTIAGPEQENAKMWISKLEHPESIKVIGPVLPEEVIDLYYDHEVVVIPSLEEGLPNVAFEAASTGRVVIASDTGGIPEIIDDSMGSVYSSGDIEQLSNLILSYAKKEHKLQQKGEAGREKICKEFHHSFFSEKYFDYYRELMSL